MTDQLERAERRAKMLGKIRKLLAMGRDGRGNATEEETAMRQANALMAEWGIAEAEADMSAIAADAMQFGEGVVRADGKEGAPLRTRVPSWCGVLAVGVARFTDTFARRRSHAELGEIHVFQGEREDVILARWLFGVLAASIQAEQKASGWTKRGDANSFRQGAAGQLARRLRLLGEERRAVFVAAQATSGSMALVVVDRKLAIMVQRFTAPQYSHTARSSSGSYDARESGRDAGRRINIPAGRPIGTTQARLN